MGILQRPDSGTSREVPVLHDTTVDPARHEGLAAALNAAGLPVDDLAEPSRSFFAYHRLDGELVGYGGFEPHGDAALIRSLAVLPGHRRAGLGRAMAPILFRRAYDAGARDLYLLTTSAQGFFERLGFAAVDRTRVPDAITATRQFASLCPASAACMHRRNTP